MAVEPSSVIGLILHFRTPNQTLDCLQSLCSEGVRHAVVVDNSEDNGGSVSLMCPRLAELLDSGLDVILLPSDRNLGFARGVAVGLEYIAAAFSGPALLINSDATLEKGALHIMIMQLDRAALIVPRVRDQDCGATKSLLGFYHSLFALILRRHIWGSTFHPSGCCLLMRSDEVRPDLFDTDFFLYGEDAMLGFEIRRRRIDVVECPEAVVVHAGSASSKNGSMFYEYHMNRAHWLLARKLSHNPFEYLAFVVMRCFTLPMRALVRSVRFMSFVPWVGLFAATSDVLRGRCRNFTPPLQVTK